MANNFNYENVTTVNFGVSLKTDTGSRMFEIEIGDDIQQILVENLNETTENLRSSVPEPFDPGQLYGSYAYVFLPLSSPLAETARALYNLDDLDVNANALDFPDNIEYYFAIFYDAQGNKLVAVKRAQQFKVTVRARGRLVRKFDGTLKTIEDDIFKLDKDFDFIIDGDSIHIYRPTSFNLIGEVDQAVFAAAQANLQDVSHRIGFVNLESLEEMVQQSKKAAKYIASISMRADLERFSLERIKEEARRARVNIVDNAGVLRPTEGEELAFLQLLDSRRFQHRFTDDEDEVYEAPNRRRVQ